MDRIKNMNETVYYNVDAAHAVIKQRIRVSSRSPFEISWEERYEINLSQTGDGAA